MSFAILTNVGRNKEAAALASGTPITVAEMAWGDGNRIPGGNETALENEQGRKAVAAQGNTAGALNTAFFEILLTEDEGPFVIREVGLFDGDGDMIAVAHYDPPVNKPLTTVSVFLRLNVVFSDIENLVIRVDATRAFVSAERAITAGLGLTGGGDLSQDRAFAVRFATQAEGLAGTRGDVSMPPLRVKEAIDQAVYGLLNGAPAALDTLKELADALGDSDDAIAAITASLATKLNAASYTAADVLAKLLTVDGAGSGLDADKLDGLQGSYFAPTRWLIKSAAYTAKVGEKIAANVAGGSWNLTLPAAPAAGDEITVAVYSGDVALSPLTIIGNGKNIAAPSGASDTTLVIDTALGDAPLTVRLVFDGANWRIV